MPGVWERAANDDRPMNPRLFLIPTTPEVFIGDGDPVINWHADRRKQYEYECELLGVVGRPMRRVPVDQVKNYMFGYANTNDISDRQARQPDNVPQDWLVQKGWDSMKPIGPFVVPQEFVDPLNMPLKMTVAGTLVQDSNTNQTWHSMYEYAAYLSNMLTVAGRHRDRTRHAARIAWRPWAVHDSGRHAGLFVPGARHLVEYVDRRAGPANDHLAIVVADKAHSVPCERARC